MLSRFSNPLIFIINNNNDIKKDRKIIQKKVKKIDSKKEKDLKIN
jgi:hypothetical protein